MIEQDQYNNINNLSVYSMYQYIDLDDVVCIFLDLPISVIRTEIHNKHDVFFDTTVRESLLFDKYKEHFYSIKNAIIKFIELNQNVKKSKEVLIEYDINGNIIYIELSHNFAKKWANTYGLKWGVPPYNNFNIDDTKHDTLPVNQVLIDENNRLKERIIELENRIEEFNTLDDNDTPKRVSAPQKALFSLLVSKNFKGFPSRNSLFEAINIELRNIGLITSDIKPNTLYKFIDDDLEINKKIFPDKQK